MLNYKFLISCFLLIPIHDLFGQSYIEIIDSLVIKARGISKTIVLDDHQGQRHEYTFSNDGKLVQNVSLWLSDERTENRQAALPSLSIDSISYQNDSPFEIYHSYLLTDDLHSYKSTLAKTDTSLLNKSFEIYKIGDSTIWIDTSSCPRLKNTFVSKNGIYTYFQSELIRSGSGKQSKLSWFVYYEKDKVFFIDPNFFFIYILYYKNGVPLKIESCWSPPETEKRVDFIIKHSRKLRTNVVTEIRYGNDNSCLENTILSRETIKRFKKANYWAE